MGDITDLAWQVQLEQEGAKRRAVESELARTRQIMRAQADEIERLHKVADLKQGMAQSQPDWLTRRPSDSNNVATVMTTLSDIHLDEIIRPEEMHWRNAYNRDIARQRLERYFTGVELLARDYVSGVEYEGLVMCLAGDTLSGAIHDELKETNEVPLPASIKYWVPVLADGIDYLAGVFGRVHVPCVPGNHGRLSKKPRAKLAALDNCDWLIASLLEERFAKDERVTFQVPESLDVTFEVYKTRFLMNHGQTGGGQGIGGIWPPIKRLEAKKRSTFDFDWFVIGHWHQYVHAQGLIINGSVKGYDEFAQREGFAPERAQQAFWLCTPEHGVTVAAPVFCADPKAEGWGKRRRGK